MEVLRVKYNDEGYNKNFPFYVKVHDYLTKHFRTLQEAVEYKNRMREWQSRKY